MRTVRCAVVILLLGAAGLAGCVSGGGGESDGPGASMEHAGLAGDGSIRWSGGPLAVPPGAWDWERDVACAPGRCEHVGFELQERPPGEPAATLEVSIRWPMVDAWNWRQSTYLLMDVHGPGGTLYEGSGSLAQVVLIPEPAPGHYTLRVAAVGPPEGYEAAVTSVAYEGILQWEHVPGLVREVLPDLVLLPPTVFRLEMPDTASEEDRLVAAALGAEGCTAYEVVEMGARRCLRFQNTVANVGEGDFYALMDEDETAAALAGRGTFNQRVFRTDGSFRDREASAGEFHPTHEHMHYVDFSDFAVHTLDATLARGEGVGEGRKTGFCTGDIGLVDLGMPMTKTAGNQFTEGCWVELERDWPYAMGLGPGWFDPYSANNDEQFVDLQGLPDGTYELVLTVDPRSTIEESDETNNQAGAGFRLDAGQVEVLWTWGYGQPRPGPP